MVTERVSKKVSVFLSEAELVHMMDVRHCPKCDDLPLRRSRHGLRWRCVKCGSRIEWVRELNGSLSCLESIRTVVHEGYGKVGRSPLSWGKRWMASDESGAGSGEFVVIFAVVLYFLFIGMLANSLGYTTPVIGSLGSWHIPTVEITSSGGVWGWIWGSVTTVVDVAIGLVNIVAWVFQMLASFLVFMTFSVTGGFVPGWLLLLMFAPPSFGIGWMVLSMVRGR